MAIVSHCAMPATSGQAQMVCDTWCLWGLPRDKKRRGQNMWITALLQECRTVGAEEGTGRT